MRGEFDPFMEDAIPPPESIDAPPHDPEPGIRQDFKLIEGELGLIDRQTPDAPSRHPDQPTPRTDRAEDLMRRRSNPTIRKGVGLPGVLEWNDDGAWDDSFGLDVVESF